MLLTLIYGYLSEELRLFLVSFRYVDESLQSFKLISMVCHLTETFQISYFTEFTFHEFVPKKFDQNVNYT